MKLTLCLENYVYGCSERYIICIQIYSLAITILHKLKNNSNLKCILNTFYLLLLLLWFTRVLNLTFLT
jgi:hypothetical protein